MIAAGAEVDTANIHGGEIPLLCLQALYLTVVCPGETSVHEACKAGGLSVARLVLAHSSRPHCLTGQGYQGVHLAAQGGHTQLLSLLQSAGASLTSPGYAGNTPLHLAAAGAHRDAVTFCLQVRRGHYGGLTHSHCPVQAGCSVTSVNYEGESCLHLAAGLYSRGEASLVVVQDLIKAGADINQRNSAGETAVFSAVRTGTQGVSRSGYLVIYLILKKKENSKLNSLPLDHSKVI